MKSNERLSAKIAAIMALAVMSLLLLTGTAAAVTYTVGGSGSTDASPSNGVNYGAAVTTTPSNGVNSGTTGTTGGYGSTNGATSQKVVYIGQNEITSTMPVVLLSQNEANTTAFSQLQARTWYGIDSSGSLPGSFALMTRIVDPSYDLANLELSAKLSDGKTAYARNFKISDVDGVWQLNAEHEGIKVISIQSDTANSKPSSYVWDNRPIALPNDVKGKPFIVLLMTSSSG